MPWFVVLGLMVVSFALSMLLVKNQRPEPATLDDFDRPQSDEGTPKSVVFGDAWEEGPFMAWFGNLRSKKIKAGGKK